MADIVLDHQGPPSAPASTAGIAYFDSVSKIPSYRNDVKVASIGGVRNTSLAAQAYTTSEIYLTGSALAVPGHLLQAGAIFRWKVVATKTAGTGAPVIIIKVGTLGTTGDTSRVTFTQAASGTSATDTGVWDIEAVLRNTGASGVLVGSLQMAHVLAATGFSTLDHNAMLVVSSGFDTTTAALIVGLTFNHGTAGAGNIELVTAELINS